METIINKLFGLIFLFIGIMTLRNWYDRDRDEDESPISITIQQLIKGEILFILLGLLLLFTKFKVTELWE